MKATTSNPASPPPHSPPLSPGHGHPGKPWRLGRFAIGLFLLLVLAALGGLFPRWHQQSELRAVTRELAIPTVSVVKPVPGKASAPPALPAEIKPRQESTIYARASGYLKRWLVDIGASVTAGQLLAEIDTPELDQELARSRAELAQTEASLVLAKSTAARWADLLKTASVSEQEASEKQADLALKSAMVEANRANVHRLTDLQSFAKVTAPFAGIITARKTDVGDLIAAGSAKELFRLAQTDTLRVYVRVPQTAVRGISTGQTAQVTLPDLPGRIFPAKVVRTAGALEASSRTLLTELELDNARGEVLAGGFAQVRFTEAHADAPLTLPSATVMFRSEGPQVGVVSADGHVTLRTVNLGRDFGATIEVLGGVTTSDQVILNPSDSLVSGIEVRLATATTNAPAK